MRRLLPCFGLFLAGLIVMAACQAPPIDGAPRSSKWRQVRAVHLKANPTCAACGTRDRLEAHHIKPYHLFPELELDPSNLITLCDKPGRNCHFVFGHNYSWRAWNPHVREDAARQLERVQQRRTGR